MYTPSTCPLTLQGPLFSLYARPRVSVAALVLPTALAEPLSQLVMITLPPRSPLALSCCALTICGNWPGLKRHVTHTTGDPRSWGHTSTAKIPRTHTRTHIRTARTPLMIVRTATAMRCGGEESGKRSQTVLCAFRHTEPEKVGTKWQNVPGKKCTERRVTFRNNRSRVF